MALNILGGTGHWPVVSGNLPDSQPGESPTITGGSPVPPRQIE